jgi:hypothetical protein
VVQVTQSQHRRVTGAIKVCVCVCVCVLRSLVSYVLSLVHSLFHIHSQPQTQSVYREYAWVYDEAKMQKNGGLVCIRASNFGLLGHRQKAIQAVAASPMVSGGQMRASFTGRQVCVCVVLYLSSVVYMCSVVYACVCMDVMYVCICILSLTKPTRLIRYTTPAHRQRPGWADRQARDCAQGRLRRRHGRKPGRCERHTGPRRAKRARENDRRARRRSRRVQ